MSINSSSAPVTIIPPGGFAAYDDDDVDTTAARPSLRRLGQHSRTMSPVSPSPWREARPLGQRAKDRCGLFCATLREMRGDLLQRGFFFSETSTMLCMVGSLIVLCIGLTLSLVLTVGEGAVATVIWVPCGFLVMISVLLTGYQVIKHLQQFAQPRLQRHVVRMLLMVPIYAIVSWISLFVSSTKLLTDRSSHIDYEKAIVVSLESMRDLYEAFVVYSFLQFVLAALGTRAEARALLKLKPLKAGSHPFPFCCCAPFKMPDPFLGIIRFALWQYVVVRSIGTFFTFFLTWLPAPCTGQWKAWVTIDPSDVIINEIINGTIRREDAGIISPCNMYAQGHYLGYNRGFFYVWMANNISQSWAIYCLIMLYRAVHDDLMWMKPLFKFIYIKLVVFFSFWQGVALALLIKLNLLQPFCSGTICISSTYALEATVVDVVICVEMFMYAVANHFVFSYKTFSHNADKDIDPYSDAYAQLSAGEDIRISGGDPDAERGGGEGGGRASQHRGSTSFLFAASDPAFFRNLTDALVPRDMAEEAAYHARDMTSTAGSMLGWGADSLSSSINYVGEQLHLTTARVSSLGAVDADDAAGGTAGDTGVAAGAAGVAEVVAADAIAAGESNTTTA